VSYRRQLANYRAQSVLRSVSDREDLLQALRRDPSDSVPPIMSVNKCLAGRCPALSFLRVVEYASHCLHCRFIVWFRPTLTL
jgi:hypothetical protein